MNQSVATELREYPRLAPTILRAEVRRRGKLQQGYLMNVSLGGAFLAVENPPPPDAAVEVRLLLPWGVGECRLKARSVWLQIDEGDKAIGAGISFVSVSKETKEKLKSYLERYSELASDITR
jgi:hypothetical protein